MTVTASPGHRFNAFISVNTLHPDEGCRMEQSDLLIEAGWTGVDWSLTIAESSAEALARHIVDDGLLVTWGVVQPSFWTGCECKELERG